MSGKPSHHGHRERLRERFLKDGGAAFADYELLELLLCSVIQRRDTKPIAKALLDRFGGYADVLRADPKALAKVDGMGDAAVVALKSIVEAAGRLAREEVSDRPVIGSWDRLIAYLRTRMAHLETEEFRVLFLDSRNQLIDDEVQQTGTVNHTPVYPREVVKRALERNATAIIMVHNHPSGDPQPSRADVEMTKEVREAGEKLGIKLHDHVIIARSGHASLKLMGLL